ncbi:MAG: hypothetical protein ACUVTH_00515 [Thermogutta sp.]
MKRRLALEQLEVRELLSISVLGVTSSFWTPLGMGDAGAVSGDLIPGSIGLIAAPTQEMPATISPYSPPKEVEVWVDGSTVCYRAWVNGSWEEGATAYSSDKMIIDISAEDGVAAWVVGTMLPDGRVVSRQVGFAIYDTNQNAWVQAEGPDLGVLSVAQMESRNGIVAWTVGYPASDGSFVPRAVGAAVYDPDAVEGGWKVFQTNGSNGRTIEDLMVDGEGLGWSIAREGAGVDGSTVVKSVVGAVYDYDVHEWKRYQINAASNEIFVGYEWAGAAMFFAKAYGNDPSAAPAELGIAVYDEARHLWKSNQTSYRGKYQISGVEVGDLVMNWTLADPSTGKQVGVGLAALDANAGGVVMRTIRVADSQVVDRIIAGNGALAWVVRDVSDPNREQLNLAFYDAGQRTWKLWATPSGMTQRIANVQIDGWVSWTVQKEDTNGTWVDKSACVAVYDPGRGQWKLFQSAEATDRSVSDLILAQGLAVWKIGYRQSSNDPYVARNVGALSYNYLTGEFDYRATSYDQATEVECLVAADGVAAWSAGSILTVLAWDHTNSTWRSEFLDYASDIRITGLTTQGRLVAWTVESPSGYDGSYIARKVGYAAFDTYHQTWAVEEEDFGTTSRVTYLFIDEQFVCFTVNGMAHRRAYDAATESWGTDPGTVIATFLVAPTVVPINRGITTIDWSNGATGGAIDYGDGWKSDRPFHMHAYRRAGVYTLTQTVWGPGGSDTSTAVIAAVPSRSAEGLDTFSSLNLTDQVPTNGSLWYSFQVADDGAFTANVSGAGVGAGTTMALCTFDSGLFALEATGSSSLAVGSVSAGTTYYLMIAGLEGNVDVALDNPPTLTLDDKIVVIRGTDGDDTATLSFDGSVSAVVDNIPLYFAPETTGLVFDGGGGHDQVTLQGTSGDEAASLGLLAGGSPGGIVTDDAFQLVAENCEDVTFVGNGGNDWAEIVDTPEQDLFVGQPSVSVLEGNGLRFAVQDVATVHAYSRWGGNDTATIYDSAGKDSLVADPRWLRITSADGSYFIRAKGFKDVEVVANNGDVDSVEFRDSSGRDTLTVSPTQARLIGPNFQISTQGFENVVARSSGVGEDKAILYGSAGSDQLEATLGSALLQANGAFQALVTNFNQITVASMGGADQAWILGTPGDDTLVSRFRDVTLSQGNMSLRVCGYKTVQVDGSSGGIDVAHLYDSTGDDEFAADPLEAILASSAYTIRVRAFDFVHAYSLMGGHDVAQITGSDGDDTMVGWPEWMRLSGTNYFIRTKFFEEVYVDSRTGFDSAILYDSPGADNLVATSTDLTLSGDFGSNNYMYQLKNFERIQAKSRGGANTKSIDPAALSYLLLSGNW